MSPARPTASGVEAMLGVIDVATLVPDVYADYRRPLVDALAFFLDQLASDRVAVMLAEQAAMPFDTDAADRLVTLMHHCPTLHKLGQVVARHRALDPGFRKHLQRLERTPPRLHIDDITDLIERELDPDTLRQLALEEQALAEASVAVVVPGVWRDPDRDETIDVVLKVLKPGIESALEEELALLGKVGAMLDERVRKYKIPQLGYADTFEEVRNLLQHEIRLESEQTNLRHARDLYAGFAAVDVPLALDPLCSPCLTGMTRLDGVKVTEHDSLSESQKQQLAATTVEALLVQPVFAPGSDAMFHADPHAGNLLAMDKGHLGILDWSLVGRLTKPAREQLAQIIVGAVTLDRSRAAEAIASLSVRTPDAQALSEVVADALAHLRSGDLPGLSWTVSLLDRAVMRSGVKFEGDLLLFRKMLLTLDGVLADVCEDHRTDWVLLAAALSKVQQEWPERWWTSWTSRSFGSHVSTADLVSLAWSTPQTMMRLWSQSWRDWLGR